MSMTLRDDDGDAMQIARTSQGKVFVQTAPGGWEGAAVVFLAAVALELGVIVIEHPLPEVTEDANGTSMANPTLGGEIYGAPHIATPDMDPDAVEAQGLAHLALARHLREQPGPDLEQVEALAVALAAEIGGGWQGYIPDARRLISHHHVRIETETTGERA